MRIQGAYQVSPMASRPQAATGGGFSSLLQASTPVRESAAASRSPVAQAVVRHAGEIREQGESIQHAMSRLEQGAAMGPQELLRLQAQVYAYNQQVEVASRVVDKAAGAVRHLLTLQL